MNQKVEKALNEQIHAEFFSFYLYLSVAAYFTAHHLDGFAHWMRIQAQEEFGHAMKLFDHLAERGGTVELMALDANLRFAQADVLIQMRDPRRVERVIEEIERRFEGRGSMLVEYPLGSQGTLSEGVKRLRDNKWRG